MSIFSEVYFIVYVLKLKIRQVSKILVAQKKANILKNTSFICSPNLRFRTLNMCYFFNLISQIVIPAYPVNIPIQISVSHKLKFRLFLGFWLLWWEHYHIHQVTECFWCINSF
jgi:hypothetical protein